MVLSQMKTPKYSGWQFTFKKWMSKKQNGDCNITYVRLSPFEMSSEAPAFKVLGFASDLEFELK